MSVIKEIGFELFDSDLYLFYSKTFNTFVVLYVNDLLVVAPTVELVATTHNHLQKKFRMKDLGEAKTFLRYKIHRDRLNKRIYLS